MCPEREDCPIMVITSTHPGSRIEDKTLQDRMLPQSQQRLLCCLTRRSWHHSPPPNSSGRSQLTRSTQGPPEGSKTVTKPPCACSRSGGDCGQVDRGGQGAAHAGALLRAAGPAHAVPAGPDGRPARQVLREGRPSPSAQGALAVPLEMCLLQVPPVGTHEGSGAEGAPVMHP